MRSVSKVGILIVRDIPRLAILIVRTFDHFHLMPGGDFDQLFCPRGEKFNFFLMKMSKSPPHARHSPPLPSSALKLIGSLHLGNRHDVFQVHEKSPG